MTFIMHKVENLSSEKRLDILKKKGGRCLDMIDRNPRTGNGCYLARCLLGLGPELWIRKQSNFGTMDN